MQATIGRLESEVLSLRMQLKEVTAQAAAAVKADLAAREGTGTCTQAA